MKKSIYLISIAFFLSMFIRCANEPDWSDPKDTIPPGKVTEPVVSNLPGAVSITYSLPADKDLMGVKAIYSFSEEDDKEQKVFASAYIDTIRIDGFPDTSERMVKLVSIDKSFNESEPVVVTVQPQAPLIETIRESLKVKPTFGGIYVTWDNPHMEEIAVSLYAADSLGGLAYDNTYYSNESKGGYSFRGYDNTERQFEIRLADRWERFSNPLDTLLKPFKEVEIISKEREYIFSVYGYDDNTAIWRGDINENFSPKTPTESMFDGNRTNFFNTGPPGNWLSHFSGEEDREVLPFYFTLDLGKKVNLSRFRLWHGTNGNIDFALSRNNLKEFEVWGTSETPKGPDDFNSKEESLAYWTEWPEFGGTDAWKGDWVKIRDCLAVGPSGTTDINQVPQEDRIFVFNNGIEFDVPSDLTGEPFRYIRFVNNRTWQNRTVWWVGELEFWGSYVDE